MKIDVVRLLVEALPQSFRATLARAQAAKTVRIGVITDMSGIYRDVSWTDDGRLRPAGGR